MRVQRVLMPDGSESWTVLGDDGAPVPPVEGFLAHLHALDRAPTTQRTYATSLKVWLSFLDGVGVDLDEAGVEHVSRFVAWLRAPAENVAVLPGGTSRCGPATVNKHLAALFSFYDWRARNGVVLAQSLVEWRRVSRGGYRSFLHHVTAGRPVATRPLRLRQERRLPRTLTDQQMLTLVEACEHLRDRFLLVLLAETGMRVGQPLGLRHADFVSHRRELRIVPRRDNANGARAKTLDTHTIPISAGVVRLYSASMFEEYGECESDYVFVNLFAEPYGRPLRYQAVNPAGSQAPLGHRHRVHLAHAASLPGHRPAAPWCRRGRGGPAAHPPQLHDDLADLPPPQRRGPARRAEPVRCLGRGRPDMSAMDAHATSGDALRLAAGVGDDLERRYAADVWRAEELGVPAARGRGAVNFTRIHPPWLREASSTRSRSSTSPIS
jgi:integrase